MVCCVDVDIWGDEYIVVDVDFGVVKDDEVYIGIEIFVDVDVEVIVVMKWFFDY